MYKPRCVFEATEIAWSAQYHGDTDMLYAILTKYTATPWAYARYASFAQSSGTGKSRMNDELARKILYIPINLSPVGTDGTACGTLATVFTVR